METAKIDPIAYFNRWFTTPIDVAERTVLAVIEALGQHPSADDQTAQDYVMPLRRCREHSGRFRIWGENQDTFYCFVYDGDEFKPNPPVYFESCLDLSLDYGIGKSDVINGDHVLVANTFTDFLWHMLGHHICLRCDFHDHLNPTVNGLQFNDVDLDTSFRFTLCRDFPAGYGPCFRHDTICIPDWGAAFLNREARESFVSEFRPAIDREWAA
jgi:hypothetical protein